LYWDIVYDPIPDHTNLPTGDIGTFTIPIDTIVNCSSRYIIRDLRMNPLLDTGESFMTTGENEQILRNLSEVYYEFQLETEDLFNNISTGGSVHVYFDRIPPPSPELSLYGENIKLFDNMIYLNGQSFTAGWRCVEDRTNEGSKTAGTGTYRISFYNTTQEIVHTILGDYNSDPFDISNITEGEYIIELSAMDIVGNQSDVNSLSVFIDRIPPEDPENILFTNSITVNGNIYREPDSDQTELIWSHEEFSPDGQNLNGLNGFIIYRWLFDDQWDTGVFTQALSNPLQISTGTNFLKYRITAIDETGNESPGIVAEANIVPQLGQITFPDPCYIYDTAYESYCLRWNHLNTDISGIDTGVDYYEPVIKDEDYPADLIADNNTHTVWFSVTKGTHGHNQALRKKNQNPYNHKRKYRDSKNEIVLEQKQTSTLEKVITYIDSPGEGSAINTDTILLHGRVYGFGKLTVTTNLKITDVYGNIFSVQIDNPDEGLNIIAFPVRSNDLNEISTAPIVSPVFKFLTVDENNNSTSHDTVFSKPYVGIIRYDENFIPAYVPEQNLGVYRFDTTWERWILLEDCCINPDTNTAVFTSNHFPLYSVQATTAQDFSAHEPSGTQTHNLFRICQP